MQNLIGKVVVITGAAEGIGKSIAARAALEGMKLVLADIDAAKLESTVADFKLQGVEVIGVCTDVSKATAVEALAEQAFSRFGNVHLLINNASVVIAKPVWEITSQDWNWMMGVNFYGVTNGLRAFIPTMLKNGEEGHIVNIASMAGLLSQPSLAAYSASKHAVVTISEDLHYDLAFRNSKIKVSVLCPLWVVKTRMAQAERNRPSYDTLDAAVPDSITTRVGEIIKNGVGSRIAVENLADVVFDAILVDCFYILTDLEVLPVIQTRLDDILNQEQPTFFPPEVPDGE